jgi:hypothetical protein
MATAKKLVDRKGLHIEAEGCIVNIREGLYDLKGRRVTSIEVLPDSYSNMRKWKLIGSHNNRVIQLKTVKS